MPRLGRVLAVLTVTVAVLALAGTAAAPTSASGGIDCREVSFAVPVPVPAQPLGTIRATTCRPTGERPRATVVAVHGSAMSRSYWNPPGVDPARYSTVRILAARGYQAVAVDRIGFGQSTLPPDAAVTADASIAALHAVIGELRSAPRWRTASGKLALMGHSSGSSLIIRTAATHPGDADALVVTGMAHTFAEVEPPLFLAMLWPAADDPRFAGRSDIPPGYVTTEPRTTILWHFGHTGNSDLAVYELHERRLVSAMPSGDSGGFEAEVFGEPLSPRISVPVLSVYGDRDISRCSSPACPEAAAEPAFWPASPDFRLMRVRDAAHAIHLHRNSAHTTGRIVGWLDHALTQ